MSLQLLENIKKSMVDAGASMEKVEAEAKDFIEKTKANEVINPSITGQGAEITRLTEQNDTILEMVPQYSNFLSALPGFQWVRALTSSLPVIADSVLPTGNTSWKDASDVASLDNQVAMLTDSVDITQRAFKVEFPIDRQVLQYGVQGIYERAINFIRASAARGTEAFILNADAANTGNVNKDGYDFSALSAKAKDAFYYLGGGAQGGLRKVGIANTAIDLSTFTEDDLFDLVTLLGGFGFDPSSLMFATSMNVKSKIMRFESYLRAYQNGANPSTAETGRLDKVLGADLHVSRDFPTLAASTGKVSNTGASNTTWSIICFYKPSVQYAYGQELLIDVTKVAGKGIILTGTFDLGVGIANAKAGMDKTVSMGRNITL